MSNRVYRRIDNIGVLVVLTLNAMIVLGPTSRIARGGSPTGTIGNQLVDAVLHAPDRSEALMKIPISQKAGVIPLAGRVFRVLTLADFRIELSKDFNSVVVRGFSPNANDVLRLSVNVGAETKVFTAGSDINETGVNPPPDRFGILCLGQKWIIPLTLADVITIKSETRPQADSILVFFKTNRAGIELWKAPTEPLRYADALKRRLTQILRERGDPEARANAVLNISQAHIDRLSDEDFFTATLTKQINEVRQMTDEQSAVEAILLAGQRYFDTPINRAVKIVAPTQDIYVCQNSHNVYVIDWFDKNGKFACNGRCHLLRDAGKGDMVAGLKILSDVFGWAFK